MLPKPVQQKLAMEFRFAADKMAASPDPHSKLFYFSAFYGETSRAFNLSWDTKLGLMHLVLQGSHQQILARFNAVNNGTERVVILSKEFFQEVDKAVLRLADIFQKETIEDAAFYSVLERITELGYLATGNGHYLFTKGQIKL